MKPIFYCQTTSLHQGMISSLQLNPFSSALSVALGCFMHTMSSLWKPHECYLLFMPSELLLIILWQCLEGLNKIRAISASHCPSRVAASKTGSSISELGINTLVRYKHMWCMGSTGPIAWPSQDPKICDCRAQLWSDITWLYTAAPVWFGMRLKD